MIKAMAWLIAFFVLLSYFEGAKAILFGKYYPSLYSRIIWFLLALNSFASIVALKNSSTVLVLGSLAFFGNFTILLLSIKNSKRTFDHTELICSLLLAVSLLVWIFTRLPLLNLTIGLIAHLVGGIPTLRKVWKGPKQENIRFWLYFFVASVLTVITTNKANVRSYLYPLYFALFDGLMVALCLRRYNKRDVR